MSVTNLTDKGLQKVELSVRDKHKKVSSSKTPSFVIKKRPDGFDYVNEAYMRDQLNTYWPLWSWECQEIQFLGSEWVVIRGELQVVDDGAIRKFGSVGSARVQFKRDREHIPENVIDIDKNVASANTNAFKRACNRLCNIADDVYRKIIEDLTLDNDQMGEINKYLNGLSKKLVNSVLKNVEKGEIHVDNYEATLRRINQLREQNNLKIIKE